jgi:hypothetical protein
MNSDATKNTDLETQDSKLKTKERKNFVVYQQFFNTKAYSMFAVIKDSKVRGKHITTILKNKILPFDYTQPGHLRYCSSHQLEP